MFHQISLTVFRYCEIQWTNGQCTGLWMERSGFETWLGQCDVLMSPLTMPLSLPEYKWGPENCQGSLMKCWWVTLRWTSTSSRGGEVILAVVPCYMETGISSAWVDRLVRDLQTYHIRLNLRV